MPAPQKNHHPGAPPSAPLSTMDQLHEKLGSLADQAKVIENTADAEKRAMNDEEIAEIKQITEAFRSVELEIQSREATAEMGAKISAPQRRLTPAADPQNSADDAKPTHAHRFEGGLQAGTSKGSYGFRSFGEWALAARKTWAGKPDARIMNAPSTFGSEGTNTDGGFALPPDFRDSVMKIIQGEEALLSRTDQQYTQSNAITLPLDATTPWQTSGGVLGGWIGEGSDFTLTKPALGQLNCKAYKLAALVPMTDELLEDVPAMTRWLTTKVPEKFNSLINDAIVAGDGVGKPQGLLNAACKITQAAESGQGAGTIVAKNILKMWGRMYAALRPRAVWLINQDCEQQLQQLVMPGTNPSQPAYMPPGGFSQSPYATLLGRPLISVETCKALGTEGDIILTDLSQYLTVQKVGGIRSDVSIHLYFNSDHTAFRFIMRLGGQSYWPGAVSRQNGSNTLSPIVTLNSTRT